MRRINIGRRPILSLEITGRRPVMLYYTRGRRPLVTNIKCNLLGALGP